MVTTRRRKTTARRTASASRKTTAKRRASASRKTTAKRRTMKRRSSWNFWKKLMKAWNAFIMHMFFKPMKKSSSEKSSAKRKTSSKRVSRRKTSSKRVTRRKTSTRRSSKIISLRGKRRASSMKRRAA